MFNLLLINAAALLAFVSLQWLGSVWRRDASLVDRFWGAGFVLTAAVTLYISGEPVARGWLLFTLTALWGLRLSAYLTWRNWGRGEDYRYAQMRSRNPSTFPLRSLFTVFWFQGALTWFIALPLQFGIAGAAAFPSVFDVLGLALWVLGFTFESVGDWQLARFKADPANRGRVMDQGLWRYTRHPNYFGDACVWWGLYLIAVPSPGAAWTVLSPVLMTVLLVRVSGAALLERNLKKTKPEYAEYIARTSSFLPKPPKKAANQPI